MRERVECANGALSIHSQPGSGTEIRVTLPLREARSAKHDV
jgi:signal transduction histidine kinase